MFYKTPRHNFGVIGCQCGNTDHPGAASMAEMWAIWYASLSPLQWDFHKVPRPSNKSGLKHMWPATLWHKNANTNETELKCSDV